MGSCLWLVMCVVFPFANPAMSMRGVKGTNAALSATPAINATKVILAYDRWPFTLLLFLRTSFCFWKKLR